MLYLCSETQLSKRVNEWTSRLEPLLRDQEAAPAYDIHAYSDNMLVQFDQISKSQHTNTSTKNDNSDVIHFDEIVIGKPSAEVCRNFLACLQLANLGNVEVVPPRDHDDLLEVFGVRLVTTHKIMDIANHFTANMVEA